jgi:hypothetical protein
LPSGSETIRDTTEAFHRDAYQAARGVTRDRVSRSMARDVRQLSLDPKVPLAENRSTGRRARLLPPEEPSRRRASSASDSDPGCSIAAPGWNQVVLQVANHRAALQRSTRSHYLTTRRHRRNDDFITGRTGPIPRELVAAVASRHTTNPSRFTPGRTRRPGSRARSDPRARSSTPSHAHRAAR